MEGKQLSRLTPRSISKEMEDSYLDYAMSVIVQRALPDARDGLKPSQRRILYAMHKLGLKSNTKFKKSATVVGEVLGKYHPHGDAAVYETLVRLSQDFNLRYPLIQGQGNFGSMDGDSAAAMRYTEARLSKITDKILMDLEKDTVDFVPTYDNSRKEPLVLPSELPQLLINGSLGIAVGMATNIPPHNITEVIDASIHLIDHPESSVEDLLTFVKGPDFPTGGYIYDKKDILQAYSTGKGGIVARAKTKIIEDKKGKFSIIISEVTFQTNKAALLEKIANLVKDKRIEGIRDIRDESDKDGVRIVIELKDSAYPKKVLNRLFQLTDLQKTFHLNLLALSDGIQPKVLNLKSLIDLHINHRRVVVRRRTKFDLEKARERAHILEGLQKALDHIDAIIKTIKGSKTKEIAHQNLMKKFKFSSLQTQAILEMKLQNLAGLERKKIEDELKEKRKLIKELESILADEKKIYAIIKTELLNIRKEYADERRTRVFSSGVDRIEEEDVVPDEPTIVTLTEGGYVKRISPDTYHAQRRGGTGVIGMATKDTDQVKMLFSCSTHNDLLFFTTAGRVFKIKSYEIPTSTRQAKGQAIVNFLQLGPQEKVSAIIPIGKNQPPKYLIMATVKGLIKKTSLADFENVRRNGLIAIKLKKEDSLRWVGATFGSDQIILVTKAGQSIRFKESNVRAMGRNASGVLGIRLKKEDEIVGMNVIHKGDEDHYLLILTENGYGKQTSLGSYKIQSRAGSGIKTAKISSKNGKIVSAFLVPKIKETALDFIVISQKGQVIRISTKDVSKLGRATQGVRIMRLKSSDKVSQASLLI
jgi:DNA gyrase subunit A